MKMRAFITITVALALLLSGCGANRAVEPTATAEPTSKPFPPTWTPKPTITLPPTWTPAPTNSPAPATATTDPLTVTNTTAPSTTGGDAAGFVSETIADGTILKPGEAFTKTWRLQNNGTTTWSTAYKAVFVRGSQMGAPNEVSLPIEVPPGKQVDISVKMTAPAASGNYTGLWMLKNAAGSNFGVGTNANEPFYLVINVDAAGTLAATITPGGTVGVKAATLSVDKASYSGACPVTLNFTGTVTTQGSGSFTYQLEAGSSTPGFTFSLGSPQTAAHTTGSTSQSFIYSLNITSSVDGWAKFYISSPVTLRSNEVTFSVKCD